MLSDRDRIFTNLYGEHDWTLKGARARGDWDGTADLIAKGREWLVEEVKASGLRGRGGAGFPHWPQMVPSCRSKAYGRPAIWWSTLMRESRYVQDRDMMRWDPHKLVEGCLVALRGEWGWRRIHLCAPASSTTRRDTCSTPSTRLTRQGAYLAVMSCGSGHRL